MTRQDPSRHSSCSLFVCDIIAVFFAFLVLILVVVVVVAADDVAAPASLVGVRPAVRVAAPANQTVCVGVGAGDVHVQLDHPGCARADVHGGSVRSQRRYGGDGSGVPRGRRIQGPTQLPVARKYSC